MNFQVTAATPSPYPDVIIKRRKKNPRLASLQPQVNRGIGKPQRRYQIHKPRTSSDVRRIIMELDLARSVNLELGNIRSPTFVVICSVSRRLTSSTGGLHIISLTPYYCYRLRDRATVWNSRCLVN